MDKLREAIKWAEKWFELYQSGKSDRADLIKTLLDVARSAESAREFQCAAALMSEPAECDWPLCECDRHAMAVVEKLEEFGWKNDEEVVELKRAAENAEARTIEKCIALWHDYINMEKIVFEHKYGSWKMEAALRSLVPAQECLWHLVKEHRRGDKPWVTSCGHRTAKVESWEFCPFKGCGAKIRVIEEGEHD